MTKYWQSLSFCRGMNMVSENAKYLKNRKIGKWPGTESNCRHEAPSAKAPNDKEW